jgi:hypothetical protein
LNIDNFENALIEIVGYQNNLIIPHLPTIVRISMAGAGKWKYIGNYN